MQTPQPPILPLNYYRHTPQNCKTAYKYFAMDVYAAKFRSTAFMGSAILSNYPIPYEKQRFSKVMESPDSKTFINTLSVLR